MKDPHEFWYQYWIAHAYGIVLLGIFLLVIDSIIIIISWGHESYFTSAPIIIGLIGGPIGLIIFFTIIIKLSNKEDHRK